MKINPSEPVNPVSHHWIDSDKTQRLVAVLLVLNAITLGLETLSSLPQQWAARLSVLDQALTLFFVFEILIRIKVHRLTYFKSAWNLLDFLIVVISTGPFGGHFTLLRTFRILRVIRLMTTLPSLRLVVESLLRSLPGMGSVGMLLLMIWYVGAVLATNLFATAVPELFGHLGLSMFTLLAVMTVEGWPDITRQAMEVYPYAWVFFVSYLVLTTFTVLNLFVGVVVGNMQELIEENKKARASGEGSAESASTGVEAELAAVRSELAEIKALLAQQGR